MNDYDVTNSLLQQFSEATCNSGVWAAWFRQHFELFFRVCIFFNLVLRKSKSLRRAYFYIREDRDWPIGFEITAFVNLLGISILENALVEVTFWVVGYRFFENILPVETSIELLMVFDVGG